MGNREGNEIIWEMYSCEAHRWYSDKLPCYSCYKGEPPLPPPEPPPPPPKNPTPRPVVDLALIYFSEQERRAYRWDSEEDNAILRKFIKQITSG